MADMQEMVSVTSNVTPSAPSFKVEDWIIYSFLAIFIISDVYFASGNPNYESALLAINGVVFLFLAIYRIKLCLNMLIMLIPFHRLLLAKRVEIVTLDIFTGGIIALSLVCFIQLAVGKRKYNKPGKLDLLLYAFGFSALSFLVFSEDVVRSGYFYFHNIAIPTLVYSLIRVLIDDETAYESLKKHLVVSATLAACVVIVFFILTKERVDQFRSLECSLIFIMIILILLQTGRKRNYALAGLNFLGLLFCFSRTPLFTFLGSPVLLVCLRKGLGRALFFWLALISLVATISLPAIFSSKSYYVMKHEFDRKRSFAVTEAQMDKSFERIADFEYILLSLRGRFDMWQTDIANFYDHPLFGAGIGTTRIRGIASSHNLHVQLLSSMGLIGFLLFHAGLTVAISGRISAVNRDHLIFVAMVFIYYANGLTNGLFHGVFNYTLFLILGLIQNVRPARKSALNEEQGINCVCIQSYDIHK